MNRVDRTRRARQSQGALWPFLAALLLPLGTRAQVLSETESMFGTVTVEDVDGLRQLLVDGVPQSAIEVGNPSNLVHEYLRLSVAALAMVPEAKRILVIGLGGGALPSFLHWRDPSVEIDVVDIDPAVVDAARRYFGVREGPRLRLHLQDARRFLEQTDATWDVIFIDAYAGEDVPAHLTTPSFFRLVKRRLSKNGVVASNVWGPPAKQYRPLFRAHQSVFPHLVVLEGQEDANEIFFGTDSPPSCKRLAEAVGKLEKIPFPLEEAVRQGCRTPPPPAEAKKPARPAKKPLRAPEAPR